ncbi:hypothetical protein [Uliginosibacterium gangwonense]|nr:hypothetical protein [Uliginosibacterium gangwonense]
MSGRTTVSKCRHATPISTLLPTRHRQIDIWFIDTQPAKNSHH